MAANTFYRSRTYVGPGRLHSYANQLASVVEARPDSILEIGKGSGYIHETLSRFGYNVTTADLSPDLEPDIVADVRHIPVPDRDFDVVACCEVLEHLPFADFVPALVELRRVARRRLVISVPDVSRDLEASLRVPKLGEWHVAISLGIFARPWPTDRTGRENHYWEIGFRGTTLSVVKKRIKAAGWRIERTWRVPQMRWHRFFVLTPRR
jgi:ubiquinone/menaquinone biosynthesis C-methylase UbiE